MLRRPISTVLSSLSIGSRLSTRLFCAPPASTNDQIPTVRTKGIRWTIDDNTKSTHTLNVVYWKKGDPRNVKVENGNDTMDDEGTKLRSLLMALEQAKKDGLKQIRVETDFAKNNLFIRKKASQFKNKLNPKFRVESNLTKYMYCERIVKIMDTMEVILEYRNPRFDDKKYNELSNLINNEKKKQNDEPSTLATFPDCMNSTKEIPVGRTTTHAESEITVLTTGFGWERDGRRESFNGIYWGKDDPRNKKEERRTDMSDNKVLMLRSILIALEQASKNGMKRIHVQTDSDLDENGIREMAEKFKNMEDLEIIDPQFAKFGFCDKIAKIMDKIEVILEYREAWSRVNNEVHALLFKDMQNTLDSTFYFTPPGVPLVENRTVPTVYVRGSFFKVGAIASLWVPESIGHLKINQRPRGSVQRLSVSPGTLPRAQMMAILNAIEEAQSLNLPEIQVITDTIAFVELFSRNWKNAKGHTVENEDLFHKIKALTETIKVHFKGLNIKDSRDSRVDKLLRKVQKMARKGRDYPVQNTPNMRSSSV